MANGYHNKILRVDLSTGEIGVDEPGEHFYRAYYGGWNVIAHYLLTETEPDIDPLGPDNLLIFAPGILTGVPVGGGGRNAVGAKSPLTGGFGAAEVGGFWGAELRRAGWDAIVIKGASDKPVYLWIQDDKVEIRDAAHLWGKPTADVQEAIQEELGDKRICVTQTGVAGENLVRVCRRDERDQPRRRPHRPGRGDGLQEAEGGRRARQGPRAAGRRQARQRDCQVAERQLHEDLGRPA